jgi:hypothetical protein
MTHNLYGCPLIQDQSVYLYEHGYPYKHTFYKPIQKEGTTLNFCVWRIYMPDVKENIYFFSVYDNGVYIYPDRDERFSASYRYYFHIEDALPPWSECCFTTMDELLDFIYYKENIITI